MALRATGIFILPGSHSRTDNRVLSGESLRLSHGDGLGVRHGGHAAGGPVDIPAEKPLSGAFAASHLQRGDRRSRNRLVFPEGMSFWAAYGLNAFTVGIGELAVCCLLGLPLLKW